VYGEPAKCDNRVNHNLIPRIGKAMSVDLVRVNRFDLREAGKIGDVKGYDLRDAISHHHGGKPRVVNLNADHATIDHKGFPCRV
jgi:hypothetical protein